MVQFCQINVWSFSIANLCISIIANMQHKLQQTVLAGVFRPVKCSSSETEQGYAINA